MTIKKSIFIFYLLNLYRSLHGMEGQQQTDEELHEHTQDFLAIEQEFDVINPELVISLYDSLGLKDMSKNVKWEQFLEFLADDGEKLILNFRRIDIVINLLEYLFQGSFDSLLVNKNFEVALQLFRLLIQHKSSLNTSQNKILHDLWDELPVRLQRVFSLEQRQLTDNIIFKKNVRRIIEIFEEYQKNIKTFAYQDIQPLYASEIRTRIYAVAHDSGMSLDQLIKYHFVHFDQFTMLLEEIDVFTRLLFANSPDITENEIAQMIINELKLKYPRSTSLIVDYYDLWRRFPKSYVIILQLMLNLMPLSNMINAL